jgi:glycosyltransferase involved in cell wall biosynthesis
MDLKDASTINPQLSIVIPCLNEEERVREVVQKARIAATRYDIPHEVIVVDDGSMDNTFGVASELGCRTARLDTNHGIAAAFKTGAMLSKGDFVMLCPVDVSSFDFLANFKKGMQDYDIMSVSKRHPDSVVYGYTPMRWLMSNGYHFVISLFFDLPASCSDTHYVKIYNRKMLVDVLQKCVTTGAVGETEIVIRSHRAGARLVDVADIIIHDQNQSKTRLKVVAVTFRDLFRLYMTLRQERSARPMRVGVQEFASSTRKIISSPEINS